MAERDERGRAGASETTRAANEALAAGLDFTDTRDFEEAEMTLTIARTDLDRVLTFQANLEELVQDGEAP